MSIEFYGIPNCDTVKKARAWLDARGIEYAFHDYKKEGADPAKLREWVAAKAVALMQAHPSTIKRPVVEHGGGLLVGFDEATWSAALA
jgi:arsenate reductase-like glutaredoxin family protein